MKEDANTREEMNSQRAHVGRAGKEGSKGIARALNKEDPSYHCPADSLTAKMDFFSLKLRSIAGALRGNDENVLSYNFKLPTHHPT